MERIVNEGKSSVLLELLKRSGDACEHDNERKDCSGCEEVKERNVEISDMLSWIQCSKEDTHIITVPDGCCNESEFYDLSLCGFESITELRVGDDCFMYVKKVVISGLKRLERVWIGGRSFTKENKNKWLHERDGQFHLTDCPSLKELIISGVLSFSDYSVCEIANNPSLEHIQIGSLKWSHKCCSFYSASLELKGRSVDDK